MKRDVIKMAELADLEKWCWKEKQRSTSNSELFSLSRALGGKKEINRQDLEQALRNALSSPAQQRKEKIKAVQDALNRFDTQAEKALNSIFDKINKDNKKSKEGKGDGGQGTFSEDAHVQGSAKKEGSSTSLRQIAAALMSDIDEQFPANKKLNGLKKKIRYINNVRQFLEYVKDIVEDLQENSKNGGRSYHHTIERGRGSLSFNKVNNEAVPQDWFRRIPKDDDQKELFEGIKTEDTDQAITNNNERLYFEDQCYEDSLFKTVLEFGRKRDLLGEQLKKQPTPELSHDDLKNILDQLIEFNILSPTFSDAFLINQDRTAYFLAKEAFLKLSKQFVRKPHALSGTHDCGRHGIASLQLDRVERARSLTSRIAPVHTLRRGLTRRALYQSSPLLDEEDLMDYESKKKVGYSIVIALDISGAVQFNRRIQGVRKACMAFGYYLKKQHPRDTVAYVAYHEKPRAVSLVEVSRLKAVNGAGKDIGGCLEYCLKLLRHDSERVPALVLIGDGLPVHGDRAGFYNFKDNNRDVIDKAYHNARLLRKNKVLFTFLQFREDRHLWQEYADEAAKRIAAEAKGILYQIDDPITIAPSLIQTYRNLQRTPSKHNI
jgi:Mg-chelatase subunit ChlD